MRVPRFRDLDENRPGCTCVRSLEKRPIRFAILDQPIVPQNRSYLSCTSHIYYTFLLSSFLSLNFKIPNISLNIIFLSLKISIPKSKRQKIPPVPRRIVAPGKNHGIKKTGISVCVEREHDFTNRRIGRRAFQRPIRACWSVNRRGRPARASNDPNAGRSCSRTCCSRCTTPPPSIRSRTCNRTSIRPSIVSFPPCNNVFHSFYRSSMFIRSNIRSIILLFHLKFNKRET